MRELSGVEWASRVWAGCEHSSDVVGSVSACYEACVSAVGWVVDEWLACAQVEVGEDGAHIAKIVSSHHGGSNSYESQKSKDVFHLYTQNLNNNYIK